MVQPTDYSFIATAGQQLGSSIMQLPAAKEAETRRKKLQDDLKQLKLDAENAERVRQQRVIEAVVDYKETMGLTDDQMDERLVTKIEAQFYPPTALINTDPSKALLFYSDQDSKFEAWKNRETLKKLRSQTGKITTEGTAGTGYQPPEQPQVDVAQRMPSPIPGTTTSTGGYTGGPASQAELQRSVENEMLRQPRTEVPRTSQDMYAEAQRMGITEEPGFKADYQKAQDIEAGATYEPGQTQAELAASYARGGVSPGEGAAGVITKATPTEKDIMTQKRLEETVRQREKYQNERNRIAAWRAAIANNQMTSDERLKIMNAKANNETDRLDLEIKIKKLEGDLKSKANKTDPVTFQPMMSENDIATSMDELKQLRTNLAILEDFRSEYDGLIKEKGGIRPAQPQPAQPISGIPRFNSPSDPGFQRLPSGSKFIDSNGVARIKK